MPAMRPMPIVIKSIQFKCINIELFTDYKIYNSCIDQDVPLEWLKTLKFAIKENLPFCLTLNGNDQYIFIFAGKTDTYVHNINNYFYVIRYINYKILARTIYHQLLQFRKNMYDWFEESITSEKYILRKEQIDELIIEINALLVAEKLY